MILGASALTLAGVGAAWAIKGEPSFQQRVPAFDVGNATGLASSPDDEHLYVSGGDAITVLDRDPATGAFEYVETESDGVDDSSDSGAAVNGLQTASAVAVSPDGMNVYATGSSDSSLAVFARNPATGRLSFVEFEDDGVNDPDDPGGTVDFLFRPDGVAVAPDGATVYAVTDTDDSVVVFDRDPMSGELSYVESEVDGVDDVGDPGGTVDGMSGGSDVTVAPDGEAVYATTDIDNSLVVFARDTGTGELSFVEFEDDGVDDLGDPGGTVNGLSSAQAVAVSPGDDVVYASGFFDHAVALFERDTATEEVSFVEAEVNGVDDMSDAGGVVSGLAGPRGIAVSPDGNNLYASGSTSDSIAVFRYNPASDQLVFVESETDAVNDGTDAGGTVDGLRSPQALAVSPDGDHVYGAAALESGLAAFDRASPAPPTLGRLSFLLSSPPFKLDGPRGVAVSPDGEHVLVATIDDDSLRSFARDPGTGTGQLLDTETEGIDDPTDMGPAAAGLEEPKAVTVSPDGAHVYVTDTSTYSISLFALNAVTGELTYVETEADGVDDIGDPGPTVTGLYEPWGVVVSPDGMSVYGLANNDDGLAAFERDPGTGRLTFVEAEFDGMDDTGDAGGVVDGLDGAESVAVSPDGYHVYATGVNDDAIAAFARDPVTSEVSFLEVEEDGVNDGGDPGGEVDGLDAPADVAVSANGAQVYAAANGALLRFGRDPTTGRLSFAEVEKDGVDDPSDGGGVAAGLGGASAIAISADGEEVYVSGDSATDSLATFTRDPATGALSFLDVELNGTDDPGDAGPRVQGLDAPEDLAVAPDDRHLYVAAERANGLAIFSREDDFAAPETTITSGPAEGEVTSDSTPSFTFASTEPGSTFGCSVDGGAEEPCPASLAELADGAHTLAATATDSQGNSDPTPATRSFTVDTVLKGAKVKADDKQKLKPKGKEIKVKVELEADEEATGEVSGEILVGQKSYELESVTKNLHPGDSKTAKLKPKKSKHKSKIADALDDGKNVRAKLTAEITDDVGNDVSEKEKVKLKPR